MKNNSQKNIPHENQVPYYIGLDLGTSSVGFAVTDEDYNFIKKKGQKLFGFRLFESAETAAERRVFRSSRRRIKRRNQRIKFLQEVFSPEISKVDMGFYMRLKDSFYYAEDKSENQCNTLFNDTNYTDKQYHDEFPTIYHLRKELMEDKETKFDIRLIYLAIAHILKKRGHFLFEGQDINSDASFSPLFTQFTESLYECISKENALGEEEKIDWSSFDSVALKEILDERITKKDKTHKLESFFAIQKKDKQEKNIIKLLLGGSVKVKDIFLSEEFEDDETKIIFSDGNYDEKKDEYASLLGDNISFIDSAKAIYDCVLLGDILDNEIYLSHAKVKSYEKHRADLDKLQNLIKENCSRGVYNALFRDNGEKCENAKHNYIAYIGKSLATHNSSVCTQKDFYDFIKKFLKAVPENNIRQEIEAELEEEKFLPKQNSANNGVIPYQLHLKELELILESASLHYPFLNELDPETNLSVKDKIIQMMTFRIPYYVGPLNNAHAKENQRSHAWIERKEDGKIYPWNFEKKVDIDQTAENFIIQMTNKCTYLPSEDVLPKNSFLYSKFMVLNELNNVRINNEKISVALKQKIYNELFLKENSVTQAKLKKYLLAIGEMEKGAEISGVDGDCKSSMKPYLQLKNILQDKLSDDLGESIITTLTLFGGEKKLIINRLKKEYGEFLSDTEIHKIASLRFQGWGSLSKKFLKDIIGNDLETGELCSIMERLWSTNENVMHILSVRYTYAEEIEKYNNAQPQQFFSCTPENFKTLVSELYCSPAVKRSIMQTLRIVNEIKDIMGYEPTKIFMEMAREEGEKKRTVSRKMALLNLYKICQKETKDTWLKDIVTSLDSKSDADLRSKKLYLYYTQMGKCMYSGEEISLSDLFNNNYYDIDHIYPRSLTKDDSLENLVLAKKTYNAKKSDLYPIAHDWKTSSLLAHWARLERVGFISSEKYKRLIRNETLSDNELAGFINRQLVETRQSTKASASLLKKLFPDVKLVYSKAGNVSDFRKRFDFVKVRELNDNHHAEDAYFNIIVGNVFATKFTDSPFIYMKTERKNRSYNLARMYDFDVTRGKIAWLAENIQKEKVNNTTITTIIEREDKKIPTIEVVRKNLDKARPLFTRHATEETGAFYKQMPLKKGQGQIPLKTHDERLSIEKYGAYNKDAGAYFILVRHIQKKKEVRSIEYVPVRLAQKIESGILSLEEYCKSVLNIPNPIILQQKIKFGTLFKINGFPMHISGRADKRILFYPAVELKLNASYTKYIKNVVKLYEKYKLFNAKKNNQDKSFELSVYDKITLENNKALYKEFLDKIQKTIYSKHPTMQTCLETFKKGEAIFDNLSLVEQALTLYYSLSLFQCNSSKADLRLIGGVKESGITRISKNLNQSDNPKIIHQSITGLYSREIDLFSL